MDNDHHIASSSSATSQRSTPPLPAPTTTAYYLRCGHCVQTVENKKYKCHECGTYVCAKHRRKLKTFLSSTYYCLPHCWAATPTTTSEVEVERQHQPPRSLPQQQQARPPSASALKGKVTVLQTSFGLIQESEHTPPRYEGGYDQVAGRPHSYSVEEYHNPQHSANGGNSSYWFGSGGDDPLPSSTRSSAEYGGAKQKQPALPPPASDHVVYNHRGELQQLAGRESSASASSSSSSYPHSSLQPSRSRRSLIDAEPNEMPPAARPPAPIVAAPSASTTKPTTAPRVKGIGMPFVAPEPVNHDTGLRHVLIGPDMQILVTPEEKVRFIEVELASGEGTNSVVRGTVLGHEVPSSSTQEGPTSFLVWHERGKRYAQRLFSADIKAIHQVLPARCKHCGAILPRDEGDEHVASHRLGGGVDIGTAVGDERLGTACGDTALLLRVVRLKQLGAGAQGEVWLCRDGGQTVVDAVPADAPMSSSISPPRRLVQKRIACIDDKDATAKYQQSVRLMSLSHVHIIRYLAVQKAPRESVVTVLMPYYHEGDLAGLIRSQREPFPEQYVSSLLLQLSAGLNFLHTRSPTIIHGDIKPENVLLFNHREQIVLMDLDASRELYGSSRAATGVHVGTTAWMAPETLHKEESTTRSDIWSLGLLAYVLLVLPDFPMLHCDATNENELLNSTSWSMEELLRRVGGRIVSRGFSKEIALLVTRMLHHDPRRRPHAAELGEKITEIMTSQLVIGS